MADVAARQRFALELAEVKRLAATITDADQLATILGSIPDPALQAAVRKLIQPYLSFPEADGRTPTDR